MHLDSLRPITLLLSISGPVEVLIVINYKKKRVNNVSCLKQIRQLIIKNDKTVNVLS
jgi:hypothetical protein